MRPRPPLALGVVVAALGTHLSNLRRKIDPDGTRRYVHTDPGVGYRFAA